MTELVTVIIPTYNRAPFLNKALISVLNQSYINLEIIIIDDGSTDETSDIIKKCVDPRVTYIYQENHGSPAYSRNKAIKMATGKYIAFLDDDDMWAPDKIAKQIDFFAKNPQYDLLYSNAYIIDEHDYIQGLLRELSFFHKGLIFESLIEWDYIPFPTIVVKKRVFAQYGFFNEEPSMNFIEDYEFLLRSSLFIKFGFLSENLAYYRIYPGNCSMAMDTNPNLIMMYISLYFRYPNARVILMEKKILLSLLTMIKKAINENSKKEVIYWIKIYLKFIKLDTMKLGIKPFVNYMFRKLYFF